MAAVLTPDLQAMLLNRMAAGEMLTDILEHPGMPKRAAIMHLRKINPDFADLYDQAKEMQADALVEKHFKRAVLERDQDKMTDAAERLAWEAAKWTAAKIAPKRYGDKIQNETTVNGSLNVASLSNTELDEALRTEVASILGSIGQGKAGS